MQIISNRIITLTLVSALIAACGGGGGGGGGTTSGGSASSQLNVFLSKGPVTGATCELIAPGTNEVVLSTQETTSSGSLNLGSTQETGKHLVSCSGGSYRDEATDDTIALSTELRTVVTLTSGSKTAVITPITEIAVRQADAAGDIVSNYDSKVDQVESMLGLDAAKDWGSVIPADAAAAGNDDPGHYGALLATLSQYQKDISGDLSTVISNIDNGVRNSDTSVKSALQDAVETARSGGKISDAAAGSANTGLQTPITISGRVSGLATGESVTLRYNQGNDIVVSANGGFEFTQKIVAGAQYTVTVQQQPARLECTVSNASGHATLNVSNVVVSCTGRTFTLGGRLTGLDPGTTLVLQYNGGNNLTLSTNATFTFSRVLDYGSSYSVSIASQPENQYCSISNGSGTITSNISSLSVSCTNPTSPIQQVDVVQVLSQPAGSTYQMLVPGRPAMVRAYVYDTPETDFSSVSLSVKDATPITMTCPASFPGIAGAPGTTIHQYDNSTVCTADLSDVQVAAGLSLKVSAANFSKTVTPTVNTKSRIDLVLVPLRIKESSSVVAAYSTAELPNLEGLKAEMLKRFPLRDINLSARTAYTVTSTNLSQLSVSEQDWENLLIAINTLRAGEQPNSFYYAYIPTPADFEGGIAGLGYFPGQTAIGWDIKLDDFAIDYPASQMTLIHELGHNLSLGHAPCVSWDTSFPEGIDDFWYSNPWPDADEAKLSPAAIYDGNTFIDPAFSGYSSGLAQVGRAPNLSIGTEVGTDIMAYCDGEWFSEYNYHKIATYLRDNASVAALRLSALNLSDQTKTLRISGQIDANKVVTLRPVTASTAFRPSRSSGDYELRLRLRDGKEVNHFFQPVAVGDAPTPVWHFAVNLTDPGPLQDIQVFYRDEALATTAPQAARSNSVTTAANRLGETTSLGWRESDGQLLLNWDHLSYPWLQITHIADNGERLMLTSNARGGKLVLPTNDLPAGGQWEIVQSDGLNTQTQIAAR